MSVMVRITEGPLPPRRESRPPPGAGAGVVFEGIVRADEAGRRIEALAYESYQPMAQRQMEKVARALIDRHGLIGLDVEHSVGRVPVGGCSLRLIVWAAHRREALAAAEAFIDVLKRDVPIWKSVALPGAPGAGPAGSILTR
jgi:molybdopterin synthase catalytic subunit